MTKIFCRLASANGFGLLNDMALAKILNNRSFKILKAISAGRDYAFVQKFNVIKMARSVMSLS